MRTMHGRRNRFFIRYAVPSAETYSYSTDTLNPSPWISLLSIRAPNRSVRYKYPPVSIQSV